MKNGLLIWNILLTLVVGFLVFTHFSGGKKDTRIHTKTNDGDTTVTHTRLRMAYFEMDSIEANWKMVKDVKAEINRKEMEYNTKLDQLEQAFQKKKDDLSKNLQSQDDVAKAQQELQVYGEQLKVQKQNLDQDYQNFMMQSNLKIRGDLRKYIQEYNKDKKYTYIVTYEPDAFFYYTDSAFNVTKDLLKGLNEQYKPGKN